MANIGMGQKSLKQVREEIYELANVLRYNSGDSITEDFNGDIILNAEEVKEVEDSIKNLKSDYIRRVKKYAGHKPMI